MSYSDPNLRKLAAAEARRLADLEIPDCRCPVFARCPECGAAPDQDCVRECRDCGAEWPPKAPRCPCCGLSASTGQCLDLGEGKKARLPVNPRPCPREHQPRPTLPACRHALGADHDEDHDEWAQDLRDHDPHHYLDSPPPAAPIVDVLPGPAKAELLRQRAERGEALHRPGDLSFSMVAALGRLAETLANGSRASSQFRVQSQKGTPKGAA